MCVRPSLPAWIFVITPRIRCLQFQLIFGLLKLCLGVFTLLLGHVLKLLYF